MSKIVNIVPQHIDSIDQIHINVSKGSVNINHTPSKSPASKKVGLHLSHNDMPENPTSRTSTSADSISIIII